MRNEPEYIDITAAAYILGVSTEMVRQYMKSQRLPSYKDGRRRLFLKADVVEFDANRRRPGRPVLDAVAA